MLTKAERAGIVERVKRYDSEYDPFYYILFGYPSSCDMPYEEYKEEILNRIFNLCDVSNMVELPLDKDGEVIRVGDTVYVDDDVKYEVAGYMMRGNSKDVILAVGAEPVYTKEPANKLTHKKPATNKSLASDIKRIANQGQVDRNVYEELFRIAWALESLGDSDD